MKKSLDELRIPDREKIAEINEMTALGEKARVIFHDLANHITALTLSIGHLEYSIARDSERLLEYSKRSEKTRIQMEYISKLLRSHIENESKSKFFPGDEICKIIESFSDLTQQKKIGVEIQADKNIQIYGNKNAFAHIVTNLITNAIESFDIVKEKRPKQISINLHKAGGILSLSVRDTGIGIKDSDIKNLFKNGYTTKRTGHGIGLFATKKYVEQEFRGTIEINSLDPGTEFLIKIPEAMTLSSGISSGISRRIDSEAQLTSRVQNNPF